MKKIYRKYERHILLGLVIFLLATFSIGGALQCQDQGDGGSYHMGGSFKASPSEREEVSDADFDRLFVNNHNFQDAMHMPSREFRQYLAGLKPADPFKAVWLNLMTLGAAEEAGYRAGDNQVRTAVEDMVGFALMFRAQMRFNDVNYQQFLRDNYRGSPAEFQEGVRNVVKRDQFLYPLVTSSRYQVAYPEAYEEWKSERERVDLDYVALPAAPFAEVVRKSEDTRTAIGDQQQRLRQLVNAAAQVRRVSAKLEALKKTDGSYPESLEVLANSKPPYKVTPDPWGKALRYEVKDDAAKLASAGPDGEFDTADDVDASTQRQVETHGALYELAEKLNRRRTATGEWPKSLDELKKGAGSQRLPGLTQAVKDGWDRELVYKAAVGDSAPTLTSLGPDGEPGTDDITIALDPESVSIVPGPGLVAFVDETVKDAWGRPLNVVLSRAQPPSWRVSSLGPDGKAGTPDDLVSGNQQELRMFFGAVSGDYRLPTRRRFETLFTHLPLVSDAVLAKLWEKYPQHRPTDEEKIYEYWLSYKGDQFFYRAEDPADPETGHGAALAKRLAPDAKATLVPAKSLFPDPLGKDESKKDDEPKADDEPKEDEPKEDEPKEDEPKEDEPKEDEPKEDGAEESDDEKNRRIFREKGWRQIVIRELFMERLLNDVLQRVRDSRTAVLKAKDVQTQWKAIRAKWALDVKDWEAANAGKPEGERTPEIAEPKGEEPTIPEEVTFESLQQSELAALVATEDGPAAVQYWSTPELMTREGWEANANFGDGLQFELNRLKVDGEYNGIPAQLHRRLTKVLVRRLELKQEEQQDFEDVREKVFERFVLRRQIDHAADELKKLKDEVLKAEAESGVEELDAATRKAAFDKALASWSKRVGEDVHLERTGLYIGRVPPPPVDTKGMDAGERDRLERRNFVWRDGYGTVEPVASRQDTVEAKPGTFGRSVLKDPIREDPVLEDNRPASDDEVSADRYPGTGCAYLIRVAERVYASKAEFSPRRYVDYLHNEVFGDDEALRYRRKLSDLEGRFFQALAKYYDNMEWMQATFDLQTNSELDVLEKRTKK